MQTTLHTVTQSTGPDSLPKKNTNTKKDDQQLQFNKTAQCNQMGYINIQILSVI